ncbi:expressed unknown protein [Seminavis robusta]|uniref:ABM domain-containing protein n=1 Tax=Seminavis robusta TaxID=568900 RepID=A0A9N8DMB6_9STRA|nr:expressed unknown protein [Seminavis robusta]|eukprot:Sro158_g071480.1 n/a (126) ;mRNA; f:21135-21512
MNAPEVATISVTLIATYKIKDQDKLEEVRSLVSQFVAKVRSKEQDTCLQYTWSLGPDNRLCCLESYKDVEGVLKHLENVGSLFGPFVALVEFEQSQVHATAAVIQEIRQTPIGRWSPAYFEVIGE